MSFNYLTIGSCCSPAAALRELNLRDVALPFDWVISTTSAIEKCFQTDFEHFHKHLCFNDTKTKLIDSYGFQFPHDYPLEEVNDFKKNIGEGVFGEQEGKFIMDNWHDYHHIVIDKYQRRIERFRAILNDKKPIIVLCRWRTFNVLQLQQLFINYYQRTDIYFINSSDEPFESNTIKNIHTEKNNIWNDVNVWKEGIYYMIMTRRALNQPVDPQTLFIDKKDSKD